MTFEGSNLEEVDEVVLTSSPTMPCSSRKRDSDSDGIIGKCFDVASRNLTTVSSEEKTETNDDRGEIYSCSGKNIVPTYHEKVGISFLSGSNESEKRSTKKSGGCCSGYRRTPRRESPKRYAST